MPPSMLGDIVHVCECVRRFRALMQMPPISMADLVTALLALPPEKKNVQEDSTAEGLKDSCDKYRSSAVPLLLMNVQMSMLRLLAEDMSLRQDNSELGSFGGGPAGRS